MKRKKILRSYITNEPYHTVVQEILRLGREKQSAYVCIANVHMVVEAFQDKAFNAILNRAHIVTPDGKPLSIMMNWLYQTRQERVAGPDLMIDVAARAAETGQSVYFYGSTQEVLDTLREKLSQKFPTLHIAGMTSPPFRPLTAAEDTEIIETINTSGADVVFVSLGCPKQEKWMAEHQGKINAVMIGVGAAFPFYTGHIQRAPQWMQEHSLEWLHRLCSEPTRLFKRYALTNTAFLCLMLSQWIHLHLYRFHHLK